MMDRVKKRGKLQSWFDVDLCIVERLDPLLEVYEEHCRAGLRPDRQPLLEMCPDDEHRQLLQDELDHYDDYYPQTLHAGIGDTKRNKFERVESEVPRTIGEYKVLQTLGRGGFGVVLFAEHMQTNKRVALKVPHPGWQSRESFASLVREANALSTLNHEGIVRFYESQATPDGNWIISTEWIDGRNLEEIAKSESLSVERVTEIVLELLAALGYAHKRGIVHRDIKPSNVMIERSGRVKLLDFGMAKIFDDPGFSQSGQLKGSIAYMSPEQASGDVHETNERSDIYGVGVLLYELLAGRRPFVGREEDVRRAIVSEPCPSLKKIAPLVPETLALICHKALAKDQADRFQSAQEFSTALLDWQAGKTVSGLENASRELEYPRATRAAVYQPQPFSPKPRRRLTAALVYQIFMAIALVVLVIVCGSLIWKKYAPTPVMPPSFLVRPWESNLTNTQEERIAIEWVKYDKQKERPVFVESDPPNAHVTFFPIDLVLAPSRERAVDAGRSPVNVKLKPGTYLVVAELADGRFTEVFRRVPVENEFAINDFNHTAWKLKDEVIHLPQIKVLPFDSSGMATWGDTYIDKDLVSDKAFISITNPKAKNLDELTLKPMTGIDHDSAMVYCELTGRRLATLDELTSAAEAGEINVQANIDEWTSTGEENIYGSSNSAYKTFRLGTKHAATVTTVRTYFGFRTARSKTPLQPLIPE